MTNLKKLFNNFVELILDDEKSEDINEILLSYRKMEIVDFLNAFAHLNFKVQKVKVSTQDINDEVLPCLIYTKNPVDGYANANEYLIYDKDKKDNQGEEYYLINDKNKRLAINPREIAVHHVLIIKEFTKSELENEKILINTTPHFKTWKNTLISRFKREQQAIRLLSLIPLASASILPLYTLYLLEEVIYKSNNQAIIPALLIISALLFIDFLARDIRSNIATWCANRIDYLFESKIFKKVTTLSDSYRDTEKVDTQVNRFNKVRSSFHYLSSPDVLITLDAGLSIVLLIPITIISWQMAVPLIAMIPFYFLLYSELIGRIRKKNQYYNDIKIKKNNLINELKRRSEAIYFENVFPVFNDRLTFLSSQSALTGHETQMLKHKLKLYSHLLAVIAAISSMLTGAILTSSGELKLSYFITNMLFLWSLLTPLQKILNLSQSLDSINYSIKQLHNFFRRKLEFRTHQSPKSLYVKKFDIEFKGVTFHCPNSSENTFFDTNIKINDGVIYGVYSDKDRGKDAFIKLINKTYLPQSGSVTIDGVDNRQFDTLYLRQNILTLNLTNSLLRDTSIYETIKLVNPLISRDEILINMELFGVGELLERNKLTIDSPISGVNKFKFTNDLYAAIVLAIPFCTNAKLVLLEEIPSNLINKNFELINHFLNMARGHFGVIFCCDHRRMLEAADEIIYMPKREQIQSGKSQRIIYELKERALI